MEDDIKKMENIKISLELNLKNISSDSSLKSEQISFLVELIGNIASNNKNLFIQNYNRLNQNLKLEVNKIIKNSKYAI